MSDWQPSLLLHWYDRKPVPKLVSKSYSAAPHTQVERVSYECPKGKRAMIEYLGSSVTRATAAGTLSAAFAFWSITPKDEDEKALIGALSWDNTVGSGDVRIHGTQITLFPFDVLKGYTGDGSVGGVIIYRLVYKLTEFDAEPPESYVYKPDPTPETDIQQPLAVSDPPM